VRKTQKKEDDEEEEEETDMSLIRDSNKTPTPKWKFSHQTNNKLDEVAEKSPQRQL
jgi:hypothetical protein